MYSHDKLPRADFNEDKQAIIRAVHEAGLRVTPVVLSEHDDEEDAFNAERQVIKTIGIDQLTNIWSGKGGQRKVKKYDHYKKPTHQSTRGLMHPRQTTYKTME